MNRFKAYFSFSKEQRIGLIFLFLIIVLLQAVYFFYDFTTFQKDTIEKKNWLSLQKVIDSRKVESLKNTSKIYPFNPNFITDYKGYKLGMSVQEIDRLLAYRKLNKYVNSAEEFQKITKVSDSLLKTMSPYFKFPDWVNHKKSFENSSNYIKKVSSVNNVIVDINEATKEDLMKIYGIGDKISDRILNEKQKLGAFVNMSQMQDIWGLSPEVIESLNKCFIVKQYSNIKKININTASVKELSQFPFMNYSLAKEIVTYRSMYGNISQVDLSKIKSFPFKRLEIIALYLEF